MKTTAVRFDGKTLRKEQFELPLMKDDEIVAKVVCDTLCPSTYKAIQQGTGHVRIPKDVGERPVIIGHEFSGDIVDVGAKWRSSFEAGQKFIIQPAINYKGSPFSPGYSYQNIGGNATYVIIPNEVMETGNLLIMDSDLPYYACSLAEPLSCIIGGFKKMTHTKPNDYRYYNGIRKDGRMIILGGAGPMGIATLDYAINCDCRPRSVVVVDNIKEKLSLAEKLIPVGKAKENGVDLVYVLSAESLPIKDILMAITENHGYDDVFVYAAVRPLVELGDAILAYDGCMNLFAGPYDKNFMSEINFYNIHYKSTHMVGLSGGTRQDMIEYIDLVKQGKMDPSTQITHIGGLGSVIDTIGNLPKIPGGKKLIYNHFDFPLLAIARLGEVGCVGAMGEALAETMGEAFAELNEIIRSNNGLWTKQAEDYLLQYANNGNVV